MFSAHAPPFARFRRQVHVRPAVLTKSSSVDVLRTYEAGRAQVERRENRVSAPLAKQESFNDVEVSVPPALAVFRPARTPLRPAPIYIAP